MERVTRLPPFNFLEHEDIFAAQERQERVENRRLRSIVYVGDNVDGLHRKATLQIYGSLIK